MGGSKEGSDKSKESKKSYALSDSKNIFEKFASKFSGDSKIANNSILFVLLVVGLIIGGFVLSEGLFEKQEAIELYDYSGLTLAGNMLVEASGNQANYTNGMLSYGIFNDSAITKILKVKGVNQANLVYAHDSGIDLNIDSPFVKHPTLNAIDTNDVKVMNVSVTEGNLFTNSSEIVLGDKLASSLNKNLGDNISVLGKTYNVTGIASGNNYANYNAYISMDDFNQRFAVNGNVTNFSRILILQLADGLDLNSVKGDINSQGSGDIHAITTIEDEWYGINFNSAIGIVVPCVEFIVSFLATVFIFIINLALYNNFKYDLKNKGFDDINENSYLINVLICPLIGTILGLVLAIVCRSVYWVGPIFGSRLLESFVILFIVTLIGSCYSIYEILKLKSGSSY